MTGCEIRPLAAGDIDQLAVLAASVWVPSKPADNRRHFADHLHRPQAGTALVAQVDSSIVGFADCCLRHDYVEGCEANPVAYLEGLFVAEKWRGQGIAAALVAACEAWAREQGCREFASDTAMDNLASQAFHEATGFREVARIVHYHKRLEARD